MIVVVVVEEVGIVDSVVEVGVEVTDGEEEEEGAVSIKSYI